MEYQITRRHILSDSNRHSQSCKIINSEVIIFLISRIRLCGLFSQPEFIWNYGSYRQLVWPLGPVAKPLPIQDNSNTEETQTYIHASSGIRTYDPSVWAAEDISYFRPRGRCDQHQVYVHINTLFSNTFSLCSSLSITDQVSHPYKSRDKAIVLCNSFNRLKTERFHANNRKVSVLLSRSKSR
jgi:hypothetical protein